MTLLKKLADTSEANHVGGDVDGGRAKKAIHAKHNLPICGTAEVCGDRRSNARWKASGPLEWLGAFSRQHDEPVLVRNDGR